MVQSRQLVTLDADFVKGDLWASVETIFGYGGACYSTHSHTPKSSGIRLVIPITRPVSPDEYQAVARMIAGDLGIDFLITQPTSHIGLCIGLQFQKMKNMCLSY
ncbi:hypothetical protein HNO89_002232 [Sporosarcina luteola]|nr:hypothetical protein [Sporosarcina luteola]